MLEKIVEHTKKTDEILLWGGEEKHVNMCMAMTTAE